MRQSAAGNCSPHAASAERRRSGVIIVLTAVLLVFLLGMIAFAVDLGFIATVRTELQAAADAAAYAGAGALVNGTDAATLEAQSFYTQNNAGGKSLDPSTMQIEFGVWDAENRTFTVGNSQPNAVRVTSNITNQPLFFGNVFNRSSFDMTAQAVATYLPRDIVIVLDYSGSMCYDSQWRNIGLLGQSAIEANLLQIYQEMGSPTYGSLALTPVSYGRKNTSNNKVKKHFDVRNVPYPYPGGSWDEYIDYVQNDSYVNSAGYRCEYGYLTWIEYLLAKRCGASDTPGLHAVSEQPITALKDAVDVFLSYLTAHSTDDRIGLSIYTYSDYTAVLEQSLTKNYATISSICRNRQAGHYYGGTNMSAGMTKAREELEDNARIGAKKLMVLMTDGVVNMPTGSSYWDKKAVRDEAYLAADAGIPIVTIALGAYADTDLMQEVADITGGAAFIVPGGQPISAVEEQLEAVFGQVAADRPLKLVQ